MKNIILIVLDSVRRDFFFNFIKDSINELRKDFVEFDNCYSIYSTTCTSHYTIFFGDFWKIAKNRNFPAQLKDLGFKNKSFCNGAIITGYPLKINSRVYFPSRKEIIDDLNINLEYDWNRKLFGNRFRDYYGASDDINRNIPKKWKEYFITNKYDKNFIFLHFWNAHYTYGINRYLKNKIYGRNYKDTGRELIRRTKKKELSEKFVKKVYLKKIYEIINIYIKELFGILKKKDDYDDSLIIITSDHGEGLGDLGRYCNKSLYNFYKIIIDHYDKLKKIINILPPIKKYFSWKWDFTNFFHGSYDKLQKKIPLFIKFPNNEFGGKIFHEKTTLFDLIHTIDDLVGNKFKIGSNLGCSIYKLLQEGKKNREQLKLDKTILNLKKFKKI